MREARSLFERLGPFAERTPGGMAKNEFVSLGFRISMWAGRWDEARAILQRYDAPNWAARGKRRLELDAITGCQPIETLRSEIAASDAFTLTNLGFSIAGEPTATPLHPKVAVYSG